MDEKFFEKILRRALGDETIKSVTIESRVPAVGKGANFLSQLWRFTLVYSCGERMIADDKSREPIGTTTKIRLIVKCAPDVDGPALKLITDQNLFETEIGVFKDILSNTERLLDRSLAPRCFYHRASMDKPSILVLEDLQPLGFVTKDRQSGLSIAHVHMALESIADFHAASVYQYEQNPEVMKTFNNGGIMSDKTPKNMFRIIEQTLLMICEKIRDWSEPVYRGTSEKLLILTKKFTEEILDVTSHDNDEFCVLNHGDCWTNNIMFREDEQGKPLQIMLIDFQMSVYSSPVIDLIYFLSVCPSIDIKTDMDDIFYDKYLERLTERMRTIGCVTKPPTIEELRRAIRKRRMWIVMSAIGLYPRMIADSTQIETFDELLEFGETRMDVFVNPNATIALKKSLLVMEEKGYLD